MDMVKTIESITELLIGKKSAPTKKAAKAKRKTAKKKGNEMNIPTDAIVITYLVVGFIFFKMKK